MRVLRTWLACSTLCLVGEALVEHFAWSGDDLPNPMRQLYARCGNEAAAFVCDPNNYLDDEERRAADERVRAVQRETLNVAFTDEDDQCRRAGRGALLHDARPWPGLTLMVFVLPKVTAANGSVTSNDVYQTARGAHERFSTDDTCDKFVTAVIS